MTKNIGTFDRIFRIVFALLLIALPFVSGFAFFQTTWATALSVILGVVLLATAAMRFCGLYALFGIRTCGR
ncbi:DUF2892 domain-containing protein [Roseovarius sp. M141]|uniref:YgaP family membrane protein n=1 Tax=Roseovarius sp. M141 TaxID=2583806 RepID=UPI0020CCDD62|nr:DUF2892 domain-containing protein [Roseovarius sp. M141]MCQ0092340.1 DUF2892 domain-containing protein [Roseovarius sp. M141]